MALDSYSTRQAILYSISFHPGDLQRSVAFGKEDIRASLTTYSNLVILVIM
jgi:hypothetical protein